MIGKEGVSNTNGLGEYFNIIENQQKELVDLVLSLEKILDPFLDPSNPESIEEQFSQPINAEAKILASLRKIRDNNNLVIGGLKRLMRRLVV